MPFRASYCVIVSFKITWGLPCTDRENYRLNHSSPRVTPGTIVAKTVSASQVVISRAGKVCNKVHGRGRFWSPAKFRSARKSAVRNPSRALPSYSSRYSRTFPSVSRKSWHPDPGTRNNRALSFKVRAAMPTRRLNLYSGVFVAAAYPPSAAVY